MREREEDAKELFWLADTQLRRLGDFLQQLKQSPGHFPEDASKRVATILAKLMEDYRAIINRCQEVSSVGLDAHVCRETKYELRTLASISAGVLASLDWQSPSFDHGVMSQAGRHTGVIEGMRTDYKRDHHHDAEGYERAFIKEYIDSHLHPLVRACATSSGMAAFTTILASIQQDIGANDVVLVGEGSYFENKQVLRRWFGNRVRFVNEMDVELLLKTAHELQPKAIFLDTLGNVEDIVMPDLAALIPRLAKGLKQSLYLILDNSVLASSFQPLEYLPFFNKLRLIVFESLNKFHQFGFDRVTGGIVWTAGMWPDLIAGTRLHLGTNIPQASVLALPEPNRELLERRMRRIEHNILILANALESEIGHGQTQIARVIYPALASYPGYAWTKERSFHGGYFTLAFASPYRDPKYYLAFLERVMKEAKNMKVDLNAGTSFGFDVTRIYLTARHANEDARPFIRISPGTETEEGIERVKEVLLRALPRISL